MTYENGFNAALEDCGNDLNPRPLRGYSTEFRNGYSDGWFKASKGSKTW